MLFFQRVVAFGGSHELVTAKVATAASCGKSEATLMTPKYVRDLMTEEVFTLKPGDSLSDLRNLLHDMDVRHVPVVDEEGDLIGLVSERDLLRNVLTDQADVPLSVRDEALRLRTLREIMTDEVQTVGPEDAVETAARLMLDNKFGCLPVTEGQRLVGILTESDFVDFFAKSG